MLILIFAFLIVFVCNDMTIPPLVSQHELAATVRLRQDPSPTGTEGWGVYPEIYVRDHAITTAMPAYPDEALKHHATAVMQAKIAINDHGRVAEIRFNPNAHPLLKQAVADAVAQWSFDLQPSVVIPGRMFLSRITFRFSINDGAPTVGLYDPGPNAADRERLGYSDSAKELKEWARWEEIRPIKKNE